MRRRWWAWVVALAISGCVQSIDRAPDERTLELARWQEQGSAFLSNRDFGAARDAYLKGLQRFPEDPHMALGVVLSDLMSIGEWPPVQEFLSRCNQSASFELGGLLFGPDGLIAQTSWPPFAKQSFGISYRAEPGASELVVPFLEPRVRAVALPAQYPIRLESSILVTVRDFSSEDGMWMILSFDPEDLDADENTLTPLADGAVVDLSRLNGFVSIYDPVVSASYAGGAPPSGEIRFLRGGDAAGEALEIEFDLEIPAWCWSDSCEAAYMVKGTIPTTLLEEINIDTSKLPFGDIEDDDEPPRRDALVVAFDRCSPFEMSFVRDRVEAIGDRLAQNAERLEPFLRLAAGEERFSWSLPEGLFPRGEPLALNATDALLLRGLLYVTAAATELAGQYDYADGVVQQMLRLQDWWFTESVGDAQDQPVQERIWGFEPSVVVGNLAEAFLRKKDGASFLEVENRLRKGLLGLELSLRHDAGGMGIFDFQVSGSRGLANDLAGLLRSTAVSIDAESAQPVPLAPGYFIHLATFFQAAWDRAELARRLAVPSLIRLQEGDPESAFAPDRNPGITFQLDGMIEGVEWLVGLWDEPAREFIPCQDAIGCSLGYSCLEGRCEPNPPWFASSSTWTDVFVGAWPVFMSSESRAVLGPLLEGIVDGLYLGSR